MFDGKAKHPSELTTGQKVDFEYFLSQFNRNVEYAKVVRTRLANMGISIRRSVHKRYRYLINRKGVVTPYAMLRALQRKVKPSDRYLKKKAVRRYRNVQSRRLRANNRPASVMKLITEWGAAVYECKSLGLGEVDFAPYDFLEAIDSVYPCFSDRWKSDLLMERVEWELQPILNEFAYIHG